MCAFVHMVALRCNTASFLRAKPYWAGILIDDELQYLRQEAEGINAICLTAVPFHVHQQKKGLRGDLS
jgi:hypothetical protein